MRKWSLSLVAASGLLAAAGLPVEAQDQAVGSIVGYSDWGGVVRGSVLTHGELGLPVNMGDLLRTAGQKGKIELRFVDDTKFVVGRDSEVVIDKFVFSGRQTVSSLVLQAAKGSFRFVSGNSPSSAYAVQTRSATLGFRGTAVDFTVTGDGSTAVAVYQGAADLCDRGGRCVELREPCGVGVADPFRGVREITDLAERTDLLEQNFPYASQEQDRLRRDFRLGTDSCTTASLPLVDPITTGSIPRSAPFGGPSGSNPPANNPPADDPPEEPEVNNPPADNAPGNPGNGGSQGNAGASPGGNDMGSPGQGRSDNNGNGGGGGNGGGNGNGNGNGGGNNGNG